MWLPGRLGIEIQKWFVGVESLTDEAREHYKEDFYTFVYGQSKAIVFDKVVRYFIKNPDGSCKKTMVLEPYDSKKPSSKNFEDWPIWRLFVWDGDVRSYRSQIDVQIEQMEMPEELKGRYTLPS